MNSRTLILFFLILIIAALPLSAQEGEEGTPGGTGTDQNETPPNAGETSATPSTGAADDPATPAAPAQESPAGQPPSTSPVFTETIEVKVVELDVFVTDKGGNPVPGLTADDFELYENGVPVKISNFYAVEEGRMIARKDGAADETAPSDTTAGAPGTAEIAYAPLPRKQRLHLVIYVDHTNIRPFHRNRVFASLRTFLRDQLDEDDRVMLISYDRSPHIMETFTSDHRRIASTLDELDEITGDRVFYESERRDVLEAIAGGGSYGSLKLQVENFAESIINDTRFCLDSMKDIVGSLAGVEGRKALLYVSDGVPMRAAEEMYYALQEKFPHGGGSLIQSMEFDQSRRFEELAMLANASRVTLYSIDAAGLRTNESFTAQNRTTSFTSAIDDITTDNLQAPLVMMADRTGGKAVINTNDMDRGMEIILADLRYFYSLGYTPHHQGDGQFHRLTAKFKDKQKGLTIRHQRGYRDQTATGLMEDGTRSSLVLGYQDNPLGIRIAYGTPVSQEGGNYLLPVEVNVPIRNLVLMPEGEFHVGNVLVYAAVQDDRGGMSPTVQNPFTVQIPTSDMEVAQTKNYVFELNLMMRRGSQRVAVAVRDVIGAEAAFVVSPVTVGY